MLTFSTIFAFAVALAALAGLALRDQRIRLASRRGLLDQCTGLFERHAKICTDDGFPKLSGRIGDSNVDVRLISDTMTIRRLPQLWLQVTRLVRTEGVGGFAVLVRPSGYEFYSMTAAFHHIVETPSGFPSEIIIRAKDARAAAAFARAASAIASILQDDRVKEIAVTENGIRIIYQASEGKRGDYLLLRQAVFDEADVPAERLQFMLADIDTILNAIAAPKREAQYA